VSPLPPRARAGLGRLFRLFAASTSVDSRAGRAAGYWARLASDAFIADLGRVSWTGLPQVHLNHNALITGDRNAYWIDWMRDRYLDGGAIGDALSLGCGAGHLDRIFRLHRYEFRSFTGIDISRAAVDRAAELASTVNLAPTVSYIAADLNRHQLPADSFDFIYFFQSLHHIEALEWVLDQAHRALRRDGVMLVNEFVGPSRFQWTSQQLDEANASLTAIPDQLRADLTRGGVKRRVIRPTVAHMMAHDPSEAVRSAELEAALRARFDVYEEWSWGGTVNHLVFQDIAGNFDVRNPAHEAIIESLIERENGLIARGELPSDFKVFLARRG
jgi:SAM-dependent methyltransferase